MKQCTMTVKKCLNCDDLHSSLDSSCPEKKVEHKILDVQQKMKIGRYEARKVVEGSNPERAKKQINDKCQ